MGHGVLLASMRTVQIVAFSIVVGAFGMGIARADRAGVESAMRSMERAVLSGDAEGYLRNVARRDPVFFKEQENWAKDLRVHVPTAFVLSIVEPRAATKAGNDEGGEAPDEQTGPSGVLQPEFDEQLGIARFEMAMRWTMPGLGRDKGDLDRTVSFPVVFERIADDDGERWIYRGEDWATIESRPDDASAPEGRLRSKAANRCRYFPGFEEIASLVVELLPEVRAHVDEGFENVIDKPQEVKVYASMRHLQASIYLSYVDGLAGWNEPGESIKLLASKRSTRDRLRPLLAHEYGHVATFELGDRATDMPWWSLEGVAELAAEQFVASLEAGSEGKPVRPGSGAQSRVEAWAKRGRLAAWDDLADFRNIKPGLGGHVYKQGQHMLGYISERFGRGGRNAWLRAMARGSTLDEATREALGLGFGELDQQWRATLPAPDPEEEDKQVAPPAVEQTVPAGAPN